MVVIPSRLIFFFPGWWVSILLTVSSYIVHNILVFDASSPGDHKTATRSQNHSDKRGDRNTPLTVPKADPPRISLIVPGISHPGRR